MEPVELRALPQPRRAAELTPAAQYYKSYRVLWKQKEASRVVSLAFSPVAPHRLAVVSGTKVGIWQAGKGGEAESAAAVSKFKDLTQCAAWRSDGRLMLAGEAGGTCAVIEMENKKVLRRFRGHGDAVTCAAFASADKTRAATGGRDGRLRLWDVATSELLHTVDAHADCLKVLTAGPGGPDAWITAGYDGKVKLWDLRIGGGGASASSAGAPSGCVVAADHGHPVEAGAAFPGGALFAAAGATEVKVFDLAAGGGRVVQTLSDAHSKVITSVCLDSAAGVLLTASFDGFAKAHNAASMAHLWTYKLPGPATCAAWRPDGKAFAVGLDDGQWQLRLWRPQATPAGGEAASKGEEEEEALDGTKAAPKAAVSKVKREGRLRGILSEPAEGDEVVEMDRPNKKRETQLDFFFRKFEYRKVVEFMFQPSTGPSIGFAIVEELLQRGALETSLSELGPELCLAGLRWLLKAFAAGDTLQQHLFLEAVHTLLDSNKCLQPPCTADLVEAVGRLENKVTQELRIQEALMETSGMLKTVTAL